MSDPLSVLILGCGDIAGGFDEIGGLAIRTHAGAYHTDSRFKMRACVEPNVERREAFMEYWGVRAGYGDLESCLASEERFDVVSVCLPTEFHSDALERLLSANIRLIFTEKPITGDLIKARKLVKAYEDAGIPMAVNYTRRWDEKLLELQTKLKSGTWGDVQSINGIYAKGLYNCGSHFFDLIHFLIGPLQPLGIIGQVKDGRQSDPTLSVYLQTETEAPVILTGVNAEKFFPFEIDFIMEKGRVSLEDLGWRIRFQHIRSHPHFPHQKSLDAGNWEDSQLGHAPVRAVNNIYEHLSAGEPLASTGRSALASEEVCSALITMATQ